MAENVCPECGGSQTCEENFHQMLFWEMEDPRLWAVHHLAVLCYYLQHPSRYSPEGLQSARELLAEFVEKGTTPATVRQQMRDEVDSGRRGWNITARPESHGAYEFPVQWEMTAGDVVAGGMGQYIERVQRWAESIHAALRAGARD